MQPFLGNSLCKRSVWCGFLLLLTITNALSLRSARRDRSCVCVYFYMRLRLTMTVYTVYTERSFHALERAANMCDVDVFEREHFRVFHSYCLRRLPQTVSQRIFECRSVSIGMTRCSQSSVGFRRSHKWIYMWLYENWFISWISNQILFRVYRNPFEII